MTIRPLLRSALYMPGSNVRALEKAQQLDADAIIMDLEDSVAPGDKAGARENIVAALGQHDYGERLLVVRANGLDTDYLADDIDAIFNAPIHAILIPKVSSAEEVQNATAALNEAGAAAGIALWVMMETPLAILNAHAIAAEAQRPDARLDGLVIGSNDLARLSHVDTDSGRAAMQSWFSTCVLAARAYGLYVLDGPCNDFKDDDRLRNECVEGAALGMDGKTLIHPSQIATSNEVYGPQAQQIAWAESVLEAFAQPENKNANVISLNGEMIERLHIEIAERILTGASGHGR